MAITFKRLGAVDVAVPDSWQDLYTVPASTSAVVVKVIVCNQDAYSKSFRLAWVDGAGVPADEDYLYYDTAIDANETIVLDLRLTMAAANRLVCRANDTPINFVVAGCEIT